MSASCVKIQSYTVRLYALSGTVCRVIIFKELRFVEFDLV